MVASKNQQQLWNRLRQRLGDLWHDDRGQSTTEYILILAVVVMIALKFKQQFNTTMGNALTQLNSNLNDAISNTNSQ